jgi:hypothetical protein
MGVASNSHYRKCGGLAIASGIFTCIGFGTGLSRVLIPFHFKSATHRWLLIEGLNVKEAINH